jgi:hypothetical protein
MRSRTLTAIAALACASLVACSSVATLGTDPNTALNELISLHKTRDAAIAGKDAATLAKQHAPDLTVTLADGTKLDRAAFETLLQEKAEVVAPSHITKLTQEESAYVAVVTPGLRGAGSALRETWKRTGAGWVLKRVEEVTSPSAIAQKS